MKFCAVKQILKEHFEGERMRFAKLIAAAVILVYPLAAQQNPKDPRGPKDMAPKVGDKAPDFELEQLKMDEKEKEKEKVKLSSFKDKKEVVLIFGSYT